MRSRSTVPEGVERLDWPTPYVWVIGRTQTNGPADDDAVHTFQDGMALAPLSQWGEPAQPVGVEIDPDVDMEAP